MMRAAGKALVVVAAVLVSTALAVRKMYKDSKMLDVCGGVSGWGEADTMDDPRDDQHSAPEGAWFFGGRR